MSASLDDSASEASPRAVVVLTDVRASRKLEDRADFGRRVTRVLAEINDSPERLVGEFVHQAGLDEFTGVVRPGAVGAILRHLWHSLHPVPVRFAVVMDRLDFRPATADGGLPPASSFDGPAFHRAVEFLGNLRAERRLVTVRTSQRDRENHLLTHLGDMVYGHMLDWTERQMEVALAFVEAGSQQEAADGLGVAQSTVSRTLAAIKYSRWRAALDAFCDTLDEASHEETT